MCRNLYIRKLLQIFLLSGSLPDWELSCLLFPPFVLKCNVLGLVLVLVATRASGDFVEQTGRTPTRTSTRPPHPLHPAPCPYRTRAFSIIPLFGYHNSSGVLISSSMCMNRHPMSP